MLLREADAADTAAVFQVHDLAFGRAEESLLVEALLRDPTARPRISLVTEVQGRVLGHALFTGVRLVGPVRPAVASILAPLAVIPDAQRSGIGRGLIERGCQLLAERQVPWLFVLGDPRYYTKSGFVPALRLGFEAPYEIEPEAAWMVRPLGDPTPERLRAKVCCADALSPQKYWRE